MHIITIVTLSVETVSHQEFSFMHIITIVTLSVETVSHQVDEFGLN